MFKRRVKNETKPDQHRAQLVVRLKREFRRRNRESECGLVHRAKAASSVTPSILRNNQRVMLFVDYRNVRERERFTTFDVHRSIVSPTSNNESNRTVCSNGIVRRVVVVALAISNDPLGRFRLFFSFGREIFF
jgi:recombinational DNA repair ATPase RecF